MSFALAVVSLVAGSDPTGRPVGPTEVRAAAIAAAHQFSAFDKFVCKYTATHLYADAYDPGGRHMNVQRLQTVNITWVMDGTVQLLRAEQTPETLAALAKAKPTPLGKPGGQLAAGPTYFLGTRTHLSDDRTGLNYEPRHEYVLLHGEGRPSLGVPPLFGSNRVQRGLDLPAELQERLDRHPAAVTATAGTGPAGRRLVVRYADPAGRTKWTEYTFAPDMGYALVGHVDADDDPKSPSAYRTEYSGHRKFPGDRWFPGRKVRLFHRKGESWTVQESRVTELTVDEPVPAELLTVELPAGTKVCNDDVYGDCFRTKRAERVTTADLDAMLKLTAVKPTDPLADTAIERVSWWDRWPWAVGVAGLLAVVGVVVYRRRSSGAA
jgi:hypothetical protein